MCDNVIWFRISRYLCAYGKNTFIAFTYIPPSNSTFFKESEYDLFSELENQLCNYMPNVFVFGDFNGSTKDLPDFILHDELHAVVLDNLPAYSEDILLPTRTNSDQCVNNNGRLLLTLCKSTGIGIVNGRHPGGFSNDFTFCGPRGLSTIDYLLSVIC